MYGRRHLGLHQRDVHGWGRVMPPEFCISSLCKPVWWKRMDFVATKMGGGWNGLFSSQSYAYVDVQKNPNFTFWSQISSSSSDFENSQFPPFFEGWKDDRWNKVVLFIQSTPHICALSTPGVPVSLYHNLIILLHLSPSQHKWLETTISVYKLWRHTVHM